jgi:hypothetical protein
VPRALEAYQLANDFLIHRGVMPEIDLSSRVKRPPQSPARPQARAGGDAGGGQGGGGQGSPGGGGGGYGGGSAGGSGGGGQGGGGYGGGGGGGASAYGPPGSNAGYGGGGGGGGGGYGGGAAGGRQGESGQGGGYGGGGGGGAGGNTAGGPSTQGGASARGAAGGGGADESRMMTGTTPLARAKARAGPASSASLRRLLSERVAGFDAAQGGGNPSAGLMDAVTAHATQVQTQVQTPRGPATAASIPATSSSSTTRPVAQVALDLRSRTQDLKNKAATSNEKADHRDRCP